MDENETNVVTLETLSPQSEPAYDSARSLLRQQNDLNTARRNLLDKIEEAAPKPKRKYNKSGKYKKRAKKVSGPNAQTQATSVVASVAVPDLRPAANPAGRQPEPDRPTRFIAKVFSAPVRAILSERDGILTLTPRPIVKPWMVVGAGAVSLGSLAWYLAWYQW